MGYLSELTLFDHVRAVKAWQVVGLIETGQDSVGVDGALLLPRDHGA